MYRNLNTVRDKIRDTFILKKIRLSVRKIPQCHRGGVSLTTLKSTEV